MKNIIINCTKKSRLKTVVATFGRSVGRPNYRPTDSVVVSVGRYSDRRSQHTLGSVKPHPNNHPSLQKRIVVFKSVRTRDRSPDTLSDGL